MNDATVMPDRKAFRVQDPLFIQLAASDLVRYEWKGLQHTYDGGDMFFPTKSEVVKLPFGTMTQHDDDFSLDLHPAPAKYTEPNKYGRKFDDLVEQYKKGRHWERVVFYHLLSAGVTCSLEEAVLDGDTSKKAPDLLVRAAQPSEDGEYQWYAVEVKTHSGREPFSEDTDTFPEETIVDNVFAWDTKRKGCSTNDTPLIGVLKIDVRTDAMFFIPTSTANKWTTDVQRNTNQECPVYKAQRDCFYTFDALVKKLGGQVK